MKARHASARPLTGKSVRAMKLKRWRCVRIAPMMNARLRATPLTTASSASFELWVTRKEFVMLTRTVLMTKPTSRQGRMMCSENGRDLTGTVRSAKLSRSTSCLEHWYRQRNSAKGHRKQMAVQRATIPAQYFVTRA